MRSCISAERWRLQSAVSAMFAFPVDRENNVILKYVNDRNTIMFRNRVICHKI